MKHRGDRRTAGRKDTMSNPRTQRQTGRTTRMLADAVRLAKGGRAVYVIAANKREAERLQQLVGEEVRELGIHFEIPRSPGNFSWTAMALIGAHQNCVVLADHYAIELEFSRVLEMLHRYDAERTR